MADVDFLDLENSAAREGQRSLAVEFAKLYVSAFVDSPAGAELLKHWSSTVAKRRTPVNAPVTEYAANEALRAFIEDIHHQIALARSSHLRVS